jgi:hypothetical protein
MRYCVTLFGIEWDDGKGEYDVSEAPVDMTLMVNDAWDPDDALEQAMEAASEDVGSLISGIESSKIVEIDE